MLVCGYIGAGCVGPSVGGYMGWLKGGYIGPGGIVGGGAVVVSVSGIRLGWALPGNVAVNAGR